MRHGLLALAVHGAALAALGLGGGSAEAPALILGLLGWQLAESAAAPPRIETADRSARLIGLGVLGVVVAALVLPGDAGWIGGLALVAGGVALRIWAIRTLGRAFLDGIALLPGHERVCTGPYRLLAHPADTGLLVALVGLGATTGSAVALALTALGMVPLLVWRTSAEDRLLGQRRICS